MLLISTIWMWGCTQQSHNTSKVDFLPIGDSLTKRTFETLSGTLKSKIAEVGFPGAITFCRAEAKSLTQTFANKNISIKRTTLKTRNNTNAPDSLESKVLAYFQQKWNNGESLTPVLETDNMGNTHYFKPIMIQPLCTGCHGNPQKDIDPQTLKSIQQNYPTDLATGYKTGDLRGAWHITFIKKNNF